MLSHLLHLFNTHVLQVCSQKSGLLLVSVCVSTQLCYIKYDLGSSAVIDRGTFGAMNRAVSGLSHHTHKKSRVSILELNLGIITLKCLTTQLDCNVIITAIASSIIMVVTGIFKLHYF